MILGDFLGGLGEANLNVKLFRILPTIQFRRVGHHFTDGGHVASFVVASVGWSGP